MVCEAYLSSEILGFSKEKVSEIKKAIIKIYGKVTIDKDDFQSIIELMKHDKKNVAGEINFVLLNDYEDFKINCKASEELINESLAFYNA